MTFVKRFRLSENKNKSQILITALSQTTQNQYMFSTEIFKTTIVP